MMIKNRLLVLLLFISSILQAQSIDELEKRHGFKDIRLNTDVRNYPGLEFKKSISEKDFPEASLYVSKKGEYATVGEVKVMGVEVKAYKNLIYEIKVTTDSNSDLYKGLARIYGDAEYSLRSNLYYWSTPNLRLTFVSAPKNKLELIYFSYLVQKEVKVDLDKKIDAISDDF